MPSATRRAAGAASKRAGEAWERYVSSQWLEPLRISGAIRCWHKLEPRKEGWRCRRGSVRERWPNLDGRCWQHWQGSSF